MATRSKEHVENCSSHEKVILLTSHHLHVNVLLSNITFLCFLQFLRCYLLHVVVNTRANSRFFTVWCVITIILLFEKI